MVVASLSHTDLGPFWHILSLSLQTQFIRWKAATSHHHFFVYKCGHDAPRSAVSIKLVLPLESATTVRPPAPAARLRRREAAGGRRRGADHRGIAARAAVRKNARFESRVSDFEFCKRQECSVLEWQFDISSLYKKKTLHQRARIFYCDDGFKSWMFAKPRSHGSICERWN